MLRDGSDGFAVREVGAWSNEKLFYLERYIDIFTTAMKDKWHLVYIDLFSGPGRSAIVGTNREIDGSPLIALNAPHPFGALYFSDNDPAATDALQRRIERMGAANTVVQTMDCADAALDASRRVLSERNALALAFIDPTAFQIGFQALAKMTRGRRVDVVITVMTSYMKRFGSQPALVAPLDAFFGSDGWQGLVDADAPEPVTSRALLDYYENRLRELGYVAFDDEVRIENSTQSTIYHLVFASKHPLGTEFWNKISRRRFDGQQRMNMD